MLSKKTKSKVKNIVKYIPCKKTILQEITKTYPNLIIEKIDCDILNMYVNITLNNMKEDDLCCICYVNVKASQSLCNVCKIVNICSTCDLKQLQAHNKCAFCNTNYK